MNYPLIIKATESSGSRGIAIVRNWDEFKIKYSEIHNEHPYPIVQDYLEGNLKKIQVLVMFDKNHNIKASCVYQGIREFPIEGGPVTLWKTIEAQKIQEKTVSFLKSINWIGFAEVEYLYSSVRNEYYLMEINPRFSANIALAVNLGMEFPFIYVELASNNFISTKINNDFEEYGQWLLPGDILNFIFNKDRFKQEIGYFLKKPKNIYYAILSKKDIKPIIGYFLSVMSNLKKT